MSASSDLTWIRQHAGKNAYTNTSLVTMLGAYVLLLVLIANDNVAAAKRRSSSQLGTDDLVNTPSYKYCVEAVDFAINYSSMGLKDTVSFYASSVLLIHQSRATNKGYTRLAPKEINAPRVHRYVAKALLANDSKIMTKVQYASEDLSYAILGDIDAHADSYASLVLKLPQALSERAEANGWPDDYYEKLFGNLHKFSKMANRYLLMQLVFDNNLSYSWAAYSMCNWMYITNHAYDLGKQPKTIMEFIVGEAKARGFLFDLKVIEELHNAGYNSVMIGKPMSKDDLAKLYKESIN